MVTFRAPEHAQVVCRSLPAVTVDPRPSRCSTCGRSRRRRRRPRGRSPATRTAPGPGWAVPAAPPTTSLSSTTSDRSIRPAAAAWIRSPASTPAPSHESATMSSARPTVTPSSSRRSAFVEPTPHTRTSSARAAPAKTGSYDAVTVDDDARPGDCPGRIRDRVRRDPLRPAPRPRPSQLARPTVPTPAARRARAPGRGPRLPRAWRPVPRMVAVPTPGGARWRTATAVAAAVRMRVSDVPVERAEDAPVDREQRQDEAEAAREGAVELATADPEARRDGSHRTRHRGTGCRPHPPRARGRSPTEVAERGLERVGRGAEAEELADRSRSSRWITAGTRRSRLRTRPSRGNRHRPARARAATELASSVTASPSARRRTRPVEHVDPWSRRLDEIEHEQTTAGHEQADEVHVDGRASPPARAGCVSRTRTRRRRSRRPGRQTSQPRRGRSGGS